MHVARTPHHKYLALKILSKSKVFANKDVRHVTNERNVLYNLHHAFCMKLFIEFEDKEAVYFALEYIAGGELRSLLLEYDNKFPVAMAKFYLIEIFSALEHIHLLDIVHRDVRPENICIDEDGHVKIVDFGYAASTDTNVNGKLYTICTTPAYLSPELLNSKWTGGYGKEVDWWAYGVIAYEMIIGALPFGDVDDKPTYEIFLNILKHKLKIPTLMDSRSKDFLYRLLDPDLGKRLTDEPAIKAHAFFSEVSDWTSVALKGLVAPHIPRLKDEGDSSNYHLENNTSAKHWRLQGLENKMQLI